MDVDHQTKRRKLSETVESSIGEFATPSAEGLPKSPQVTLGESTNGRATSKSRSNATGLSHPQDIPNDARNEQSTPKPQTEATNLIHPQEQSRLMQLPQELKDLICEHLFRSTRIALGRHWRGHNEYSRVVGATKGNAVSILRSCRRSYVELGDRWLGQVMFQFEDQFIMMNTLSALPEDVLSKIRHVRYWEHWMWDCVPVYYSQSCRSTAQQDVNEEELEMWHCTAKVLKSLPTLQLDTLTVLRGSIYWDESWTMVENLIESGSGWKKLQYIDYTSHVLSQKDPLYYGNVGSQPETWVDALHRRDKHASIKVYRSKDVASRSSILHADKRVLYGQADADFFSEHLYHNDEERRHSDYDKSVLIVVERAPTACDEEDHISDSGEGSHRDIADSCSHHDWPHLREEIVEGYEVMFCKDFAYEPTEVYDDRSVKFDEYTHVDDCSWTPSATFGCRRGENYTENKE